MKVCEQAAWAQGNALATLCQLPCVTCTIANMCRGKEAQVQAIIDAGLEPPIIQKLNSNALEMQKLAFFTILLSWQDAQVVCAVQNGLNIFNMAAEPSLR